MVNFNLSLTAVNVQSLSILQTLGTIPNNPAINSDDQALQNFKNLVNDMLLSSENTPSDKEISELTSALNTNPSLKEAVYQATAVLNIMGQTQDIALKQPSDIELNPVVNNILSDSNFTTAEKDVFLKSIKVAAVEISVRQMPVQQSVQLSTLIPESPNKITSTGGVRFTPEIQTLSSRISTPSAVQPAASALGNAVQAQTKTIQASPATVYTDMNDGKFTAAADALKAAIRDYIYNVLGVNDKNELITPQVKKSAQDLTKKAEEAAENIVQAAHLSFFAANQPAGTEPVVTDAQGKTALDNTAESVNSLLTAYTIFSAQIVQLSYQLSSVNPVQQAKPSEVPAVAPSLTALGSSTTGSDDQAAAKYQIVTSAGEPVKDAISTVITLLNEMNGSMEATNTYTFDMKLVEAQIAKFAGITPDTNAQNRTETITVQNKVVIDGKNINVNETSELISSNKAEAEIQSSGIKFVATVNNYKESFTQYIPQINADTVNAAELSGAFTKYMPATDFKAIIENKLSDDVNLVKTLITPASDTVIPVINTVPVTTNVFAQAADFAVKVKQEVIVKQVVEAVFAGAVASKRSEIKLLLRPDNLGPVSVNLESKDGIITAHMRVQNSDVRDVLKVNVAELKDNLMKAGVNVSEFTISLMNHNTGNGSYDARTPNKYMEWEGSALNITETAENTAGYTESGNGYLNLFA